MMSFRKLLRRISRRARRKPRRQDSISLPTNFEHRVHVILDEDTGKYIGLPPQWASIMNTKMVHLARRSNSSPDLRHHYAKQNGVVGNNNSYTNEVAKQRLRNSFQNDQDLTIERLKHELRDHKAKATPRLSKMNRYSWQEGPSTFPKENGKGNNGNMDGKQRNSGVLSPNSLTAMLRSESSV